MLALTRTSVFTLLALAPILFAATPRANPIQAQGGGPPPVPTIVGQTGGPVLAVAHDGRFAYVGVGPRVVALDGTDPRRPRVVGRSGVLPAEVNRLVAAGDVLFVGDGRGLSALDVRDPAGGMPLLGQKPLNGGVGALAVEDGYAYVGVTGQGAAADEVVDVSDPGAMVRVDRFGETGPHSDIALGERFAYAPAWMELAIFERTPGAYFREVGRTRLYATGYGAALADDGQLLLSVRTDLRPELRRCGLDTPGALPCTSVLGLSRPADVIELHGSIALVGSAAGGFAVVDLSGQGLRVLSAVEDLPTEDIAAVWDVAYVAAGKEGLVLLDIADPEHPRRLDVEVLGPTWCCAEDVEAVGNTAFVAAGDAGLVTVDWSDPADPFTIGRVPGILSSSDLALDAEALYSVGRGEGDEWRLTVIDVGDLRAARVVGTLDLPAQPVMVSAEGPLVVLPSRDNGLLVVDVHDPARPRLAASRTGSAWRAVDALVHAGQAYVEVVVPYSEEREGRPGGLRVLDLADPTTPREVGYLALRTQSETRGMALEGGTLHLSAVPGPYERFLEPLPEEIVAVDVRDPSRLQRIGTVAPGTWTQDLALRGGSLVAVSDSLGNRFEAPQGQVLVAGTAAGSSVSAARLPDIATGLAVFGDHALVTTGRAGLVVFALDGIPPTPTLEPAQTPETTPTRRPTLPAEPTDIPLPTTTPAPTDRPPPPTPPHSVLLPITWR